MDWHIEQIPQRKPQEIQKLAFKFIYRFFIFYLYEINYVFTYEHEIRESLYTIFHQTTAIMSKQEISTRGEIHCLLPELVSNLQKDLYFYAPENTVTRGRQRASQFYWLSQAARATSRPLTVTMEDLEVNFFLSNNGKNLC